MRVVGLFLLCINVLFAIVTSSVDKNIIDLGERVEYSITAFGEEIEFPEIVNIDGTDINSVSIERKENFINGKYSYMITKTYILTPTKDITIPSFKVLVNKKEQFTSPVSIKVNKVVHNDNFMLELTFDKKEAFVNEMIKAKLIFKMDKTKSISDISHLKLPFDGFWSKDIDKEKKTEDTRYNILEKEYILFPQKAGEIKVPSASLSIIINKIINDFGFAINRPFEQKVYSNENVLNIKPLPKDILYVGDFDINMNIDKKEVKANEAVNIQLQIDGNGNVDDIKDFVLKIDNTNIFTDKAIKSFTYSKDKYKANFVQKFAIVSNQDYTIPAMKFAYYSLKDDRIKEISTKPIDIKVLNAQNKEQPKIETFDNTTPQQIIQQDKNLSLEDKIVYFSLGFFVAVLFIVIFIVLKKVFANSKIKIYKPNSDKEKLKLLLPMIKKDKNIDEMIEKLEENIYFGKKNKIIIPKGLINLDKKKNNL